MQGNGEFFQSGVPGALTQAIGAAMHDFGAGLHARELCGHRHTEIVMGMHFDRQAGP